jgi:hypothetical protein
MKTYILLFVILFSSSVIYSTTIRVPQDYVEIQQAINVSQDGDTILVDRGVYKENINFRGKGITLASNFIFTWDFEDINLTIIDGSEPEDPDSASCVLMYKPNNTFSDDSSAALIGFTLTAGTGTAWEDEHGIGNYFREGGGILIQYWAPRIRFNIIKDNQAYNKTGLVSAGGGAIRCGDGNPLIENNIILHNRGRYGGGIVFNYSGGVIRNNIIADNFGGEDYAGGGIWILANRFDNKIKVVENNTLVNNSSVLPGGGIYVWSSNNTYIQNNVIWGNIAPSNPQLRVQSSQAQIIYNDVEGGYTGEGNINLDPLLIQPGYYLDTNSPCIDAGKDSIVFNDKEDPASPGNDLWPSKGTIRNDMGVFGGPHCYALPPIIVSVENDNEGSFPQGFNLFQNYPNPFNPSTKISWQCPESGHQSLKIYDVLGNEVVTLVNEDRPSGKYEITFDASTLTSGIYFYQLSVGDPEASSGKDFIQTMKMILIK